MRVPQRLWIVALLSSMVVQVCHASSAERSEDLAGSVLHSVTGVEDGNPGTDPSKLPHPRSEVETLPEGDAPPEPLRLYLSNSRTSVYFERGSAELTNVGKWTVSENAQRLREHSQLSVTLIGFTDDLSSSALAIALASRRIAVVAAELLRLGVSRRQIRSTAYGQEDPGALPCQSEICRVSYRRVDFRYDNQANHKSPVAQDATGKADGKPTRQRP